ncbi:Uu.00g033550.m01.CDS01 [Anthostomella pinea]|uniref:Uu.00g033550.m01.CDS01 n=1 Tax=Anthostomella pinea TaxID=933095 RepID=A0AAI8V9H5_9PEZI|nr:Uu.00g033550.m01.CDS01 [Anthostomella pinea]
MLYDLNIAWSPATSRADLERTLKFSSTLGYDVVALNHTITPPIPPQITNPLPKFTNAPDTIPTSSTTRTATTSNASLPTVLHRATLLFADPSRNHGLPQLASAYDLLAIRPTTSDAFEKACVSITEASLISLDLTTKQPFHFRPKPCMAAISRGVRFEVCYAQVLSPGADARARAVFIGNVAQLVRATRGRGIVVSSEARKVLGLRAPADVVNLLNVWGLSTDKAREGLGALARGVVVNEGIRRSGFRGVVDVVGVAERGEADMAAGDKSKDGGGVGGNRKRKNGDGDGEPPQMSKRQAKKMKAALRQKEAAEKTQDKDTAMET